MNLRGIANAATRSVNPNVTAAIYKSSGYSTAEDGSQVPAYAEPVEMQVQKQAITQSDLRHLDDLNIQGQFVSIYTNGNWCGLNRKKDEGGDLFVIGDDTWLVISVPEIWPDWTRVIGCLQLT